jgi:hypothetical protein
MCRRNKKRNSVIDQRHSVFYGKVFYGKRGKQVPVLSSRISESPKDPNPARLPVSRHDVVPRSAS